MQSTGHSSTQARSSTSTQGSAITYVTSVLQLGPVAQAAADGHRQVSPPTDPALHTAGQRAADQVGRAGGSSGSAPSAGPGAAPTRSGRATGGCSVDPTGA